jgi:hypothetical protein
MIRIRTRFDKPFSKKNAIEKLYTESLPSEAELYFMPCPSCGACGELHVHGYYSRNVVQFCGSESVDTVLRVMRLKCKSCGHTHALLPDVIVPYLQYGLAFLLKVILASYARKKRILKICEKYGISPTNLYRWRALYLKHRKLWLSVLRQKEESEEYLLKQLLSMSAPSDLLQQFFSKTLFSFLQSHANPANCRQRPSAGKPSGA